MILHYTDIQTGKFPLFDSSTESGYGLRLDNIIDCCKWIADIIRERKPKLVINGGDNFDPIGMLDTDTLSAGTKAISEINKACIEIGAIHIMLVGNHDYSYISGKTSSVDHFGFLSEIEVVKTPKTFEFNGQKILLIPYIHDDKYVQDVINQATYDGVKIGFTHLDIKGFKFNSKSSSDYGIDPKDIGIKIYNGHFHVNQRIGNIFSPGSSIQHKYSEFSLDRGILWFNDKFEEEFIRNTISPFLYKAKTISELSILPDNSYVWLDYNPKDISDEDVNNSLSRFKKYMITRSIDSYEIMRSGVKLIGKTESDIFDEYVDSIYKTSLDKDKLRSIGNLIIKDSVQ